jgi:hypothetical protein
VVEQDVTVLCDSGAMRQAGLLAARDSRALGKTTAFEPPCGAAAGQRDPVRHLACDIEEARFQAVRLQNHGGEGNGL